MSNQFSDYFQILCFENYYPRIKLQFDLNVDENDVAATGVPCFWLGFCRFEPLLLNLLPELLVALVLLASSF